MTKYNLLETWTAGCVLTLDDLLRRFDGQPIPNCPGRYVLRGVDASQGPSAVVGSSGEVTRHPVPTVRDRVVVTKLADWGLISYARADGTWLHTVNTPEGFQRKLADLGIVLLES